MSNAFDGAQLNADKNGSDASPDAVTKTCPAWKIEVTVKSKVDYWPREQVRVWLTLKDGDVQHQDKYVPMASTTSPPVAFTGRGPQRYAARASTPDDRWTFAEKIVEVTSKDVSVELVIEPQKWAAFKVVDAATKERIEGAKLKLELGPDGKKQDLTTSAKADDRNAELFFLSKEGTSKVTELTHGDDVWEVASVTSE